MTTLRFEPLALQIAKLVSIDRLLGADRLNALPGSEASALPADVRDFMSCYMRVAARRVAAARRATVPAAGAAPRTHRGGADARRASHEPGV
jgi:hypothetical protein